MELVGVGFDLSGRVSTLVLAVTPGVDNAVGGDTFSWPSTDSIDAPHGELSKLCK